MSRITQKEKEVQQRMGREEALLLAQLRADSKETKQFHKEFHEQISNLGNKRAKNDN